MRVLIVEDNEELRKFIVASLKENDIEAEGGPSVDDIAERVENGDFDVLIIDSVLGEGDGIGLTQQIRSGTKGANVPIILTSTIATGLARRMAMSAGCTEFLIKPFGINAFVKLIQKLT